MENTWNNQWLWRETHSHTHTQTRISRLVDDGSKLDKTKILMMATLILKTNLNSIRWKESRMGTIPTLKLFQIKWKMDIRQLDEEKKKLIHNNDETKRY